MIRRHLEQTDDYDSLPEAIRQFYTKQQWEWMTDDQKKSIVQDNTEPEWDE